MTHSPPLLRALAGEPIFPPPVWLMRQAGRYLPEYRAVRAKAGDFLSLCLSPKLAAEVTLQPIRRFAFDAAIVFADILLVPKALGVELRFDEGEGPRLSPVRDSAAVGRLAEAAHVVRELAPVFETIALVRRSLPPDVALIGFAGAPWTVATYMAEGRGSNDQAQAKLWAYREPDGFGLLIDRLVEATCLYLEAQAAAGAQVLQIFDSWAGGLSEPMFERWCIEPTRRIVDRLRRTHPQVPVIGFPRGAGALAIRYARETGIAALGLDTAQPIAWMRSQLDGFALQGNLDPLALLANGDALEKAAALVLSQSRGAPFVFNLGHGILPQTDPDAVAHLMRVIRNAI